VFVLFNVLSFFPIISRCATISVLDADAVHLDAMFFHPFPVHYSGFVALSSASTFVAMCTLVEKDVYVSSDK
jgi:hypothetical protein